MNKTLIYGIIVIVLGGISAFILLKPSSTLADDEKIFSIDDVTTISKIFMVDMEGSSILLERKVDHWRVNGKFNARRDAVAVLLSTIKKVRTYYPVAVPAHNNAVKEMAAHHVKVQIYGEKRFMLFFKRVTDEPILTYYVGGSTNDHTGTFMFLAGSPTIYVTHIPGFEGYLTPRYFVIEKDWRERIVFDFTPEDIRTISIDYPLAKANGLIIDVDDNNSPQVKPFHSDPGLDIPQGSVNQNLLTQYLANFKGIGLENYVNSYYRRDSITATTPFAIITVTDKDGKETNLSAYYMPINKRSKMKFDTEGNPLKFDRDRMFALVNDEVDFVVIQWYVFGKILLTYENFLTREG
ncbi:MAG: hypothetical protein IIA45_02755 [Bacteroidetes bacterium]|nr:hypothetical protein [Bacteroidota bacterium]